MKILIKKLETLKSHSRFWELIDLRKNALAKDGVYQQRLVGSRYVDNYNDIYSGASYEYNYNFDFELSKNDIRDIKNLRLTDRLIEKIENDLGMLDNNPIYALDIEPELDFSSLDIPIASDDDLLNMFPLYDDLRALKDLAMVFIALFFNMLLSSYTVILSDMFMSSSIVKNIFLSWANSIKPKKVSSKL